MEGEKIKPQKEVDVENASIVSQILSEILDLTYQSAPSTSSYCCSNDQTMNRPTIGGPSSTVQGGTSCSKTTKDLIEDTPMEGPYKTCTVKEILTEILDCTVICRPSAQSNPISERSDRSMCEPHSPPPEYFSNSMLPPRPISNGGWTSDVCVGSRMQYTVKEVLSEIMDYTVFKKMDQQISRPSTSRSGQLEREENVREYEVYRAVGAGIVNSSNVIHDEAYLQKKNPIMVQRLLPSYSSVLRMDPNPKMLGSCGSFVPRRPPPSYAEVEGIWEDSPSLISSESAVFGPDPTYMICPRCRTAVVTDVQVHRSIITHLIALCLCLCMCWPCCLMPYCLRSCNYTQHNCPHCSYYFGMYRPF